MVDLFKTPWTALNLVHRRLFLEVHDSRDEEQSETHQDDDKPPCEEPCLDPQNKPHHNSATVNNLIATFRGNNVPN